MIDQELVRASYFMGIFLLSQELDIDMYIAELKVKEDNEDIEGVIGMKNAMFDYFGTTLNCRVIPQLEFKTYEELNDELEDDEDE